MITEDRRPAELVWLERAAWLLDDAFELPIIRRRVGLDPLLGLVPGGGDTVAALMSLGTLLTALRLNVPRVVLVRMGLNIAFDYMTGLVPLLGDLFDFAFKANRRNMVLLRQHATGTRTPGPADYAVVGGVILALSALFVAGIWLGLATLRWLLTLLGGA